VTHWEATVRALIGVLLVSVCCLVLASCSSGGKKAPAASPAGSAPTSATTASGAPSASARGTVVTVTEAEFRIDVPSKTFKPGTYTFKVTNKGNFPHNLTFDGPGVEEKATSTLSPGSSGEVTVTFQQGRYEAYCSVDGHKDKGMDLMLQVS
jgi:uncharacterized cupredoxin-like copper-binding protein